MLFHIAFAVKTYSLSFSPLTPDDFKCPVKEEVTITSGEWEVLANHGAKVKCCPKICLLTLNCIQSRTNYLLKSLVSKTTNLLLLCVCSVRLVLRFGWTRQRGRFTSREPKTLLWSITSMSSATTRQGKSSASPNLASPTVAQ